MISLINKTIMSLREKGIAETWLQMRGRLERPIRRYIDGRFDRVFGTDTSGVIELRHLTTTRDNTSECIWYQPVPETALRRILQLLALDYNKYRFVDYGSGKGRALLIASQHPFQEVIGVEFAPVLHEIAEKNIALFAAKGHSVAPIRSLMLDAVEFVLPPGPVVCFLFTPFKGEIMTRVLQHISDHARSHEVVLVYHGRLAENIAKFDALGWARQEYPMPPNLLDVGKYRLLVYIPQR